MGLSSLHIQYCSPRGRGLDLFRNPECWRGRGGGGGTPPRCSRIGDDHPEFASLLRARDVCDPVLAR